MNLWIRSQDRETLLKVGYLYIPISRDKEHFGIYTKNGIRDEYLGIYKTKERALEVLDEIHNILKPKFKVDVGSIKYEDSKDSSNVLNLNYDCEVLQLNTYVYEMPKE